MLATSSLSVEIWQKILRHSIGVPDFLDADAYQGVLSKGLFTESRSRLNDESAYWQSERTRNILQRVCMSWDDYMRLFEHRYVRMLDVHHEKVPSEKLKRAIRVSFGAYQCRCREYCSYERSFLTFHLKTLQEVGNMDMQIADMMQEKLDILFMVHNSEKFKALNTVIGPKCLYSGNFARLVSALPKLRHFYGRAYRGEKELGLYKDLVSRSLVTLILRIGQRSIYDTVKLDLPSLRHLRINVEHGITTAFLKAAVLHMLRCAGHQLRSLLLSHSQLPAAEERIDELWDLCPRLQSFCTGFSLLPSPPRSHPIHTLAVQHRDQLQALQSLPEWPRLQRVVMYKHSWAHIGEKYSYPSLQSRGDVLVDKDGLTWDKFQRKKTESLVRVVNTG